MKNYLFYFLVIFSFYLGFSQNQNYSDAFIEKCIREVFNDKANELVFESSSVRLRVLNRFMKHQTYVEYHPEYRGKKFTSTNELPLFNKYNYSLKRDVIYNKEIFNPLKYNISMNPKKKMMYRIADTDYILYVLPNQN